ncbi:MAG: glutamate racemase [Oscillospiraceae bacterium]|nr:glutamate racemase [Oscillospiraceae bacterium]
MDNRPIGVFDSGVGGLTAMRELMKLLPNEDIVYFGDTGRIPYGVRSDETVIKYAREDINFLMSRDVKCIIAACGTVSAVFPGDELDFIYSGVVLPACSAACNTTANGRIGVIGTAAAIRSGAYKRAIGGINENIAVTERPCPLFVPLVENGYYNKGNPVTTMVAEDYLGPLLDGGIDTLILGCTHFPLISHIIEEIAMGVTLIDPGRETAIYIADMLDCTNMTCQPGKAGRYSFYVSDSAEMFRENAAVFLGGDVAGNVEKIELGV